MHSHTSQPNNKSTSEHQVVDPCRCIKFDVSVVATSFNTCQLQLCREEFAWCLRSTNGQTQSMEQINEAISHAVHLQLVDLGQLSVLPEDSIHCILHRLNATDKPLTLWVDGSNIVEKIYLILNEQSSAYQTTLEVNRAFHCLDQLWFAWMGQREPNALPCIDILREIDPNLIDRLHHLIDDGPSHVQRSILEHICLSLSSCEDAFDRPELAEFLMKVVMFQTENEEISQDMSVVLSSLDSSSNAWCVLRNLQPSRRSNYFSKIFQREQSRSLFWTDWFISSFIEWVTKNDGLDSNLLSVMEEVGLWEFLSDWKSLDSFETTNKLGLIEDLCEGILSHSLWYKFPNRIVEMIVTRVDEIVHGCKDSRLLEAFAQCMTGLIHADVAMDREEFVEKIPKVCEHIMFELVQSLYLTDDVGDSLAISEAMYDALMDDENYDIMYGFSKDEIHELFDELMDMLEERCSSSQQDFF